MVQVHYPRGRELRNRGSSPPDPFPRLVPALNPALDVLVVGKGPAALAATAALTERGLAVGVLGPPGPVRWPAQYGAWADDLDRTGFGALAEHRWAEAAIGLGGDHSRVLSRAYVRVDRDALADLLVAHCDQQGVRWIDGVAAIAEHDAAGSVVRCVDGTELRARIIIDASGHRPALLHRPDTGSSQGFQTAVGWTLRADPTPRNPQRMTLMDWDDAHLPPGDRRMAVPSFLYAMPFGDGRWFVEETVLVGRPAVPFAALEGRLRARLRVMGISAEPVLEREQCWIPMGGALPPVQRVVGFGGAAGMVHPATGYLLTRVLAGAPPLADAIAAGLGSGGSPTRAARAAWDAIWPAERRRRHALFRFGMEALLRLDTSATRDFFDTFFDLPEPEWTGYLADRLPTAELAATMSRLFLRAPNRVRTVLLRAGAGAPGLNLAGTLLRAAAGR